MEVIRVELLTICAEDGLHYDTCFLDTSQLSMWLDFVWSELLQNTGLSTVLQYSEYSKILNTLKRLEMQYIGQGKIKDFPPCSGKCLSLVAHVQRKKKVFSFEYDVATLDMVYRSIYLISDILLSSLTCLVS